MFQIQKGNLLPQNSAADVLIGLSGQRIVPHQGFSLIGGNHHIFIIRHNADQRNRKDIHHIA